MASSLFFFYRVSAQEKIFFSLNKLKLRESQLFCIKFEDQVYELQNKNKKVTF